MGVQKLRCLVATGAVIAAVHGPFLHPPHQPRSRTTSTRSLPVAVKVSTPTRTKARAPRDLATPAERAYLACVRKVESHDSFWRWGYYPHGSWGDGGGAWQMEPGTQAQAAAWAHLPVSLHSAGAQFREALVLLRHVGTEPWSGDACTYQAP